MEFFQKKKMPGDLSRDLKKITTKKWKTYPNYLDEMWNSSNVPQLPLELWILICGFLDPVELISAFHTNIKWLMEISTIYITSHLRDITYQPISSRVWRGDFTHEIHPLAPRLKFLKQITNKHLGNKKLTQKMRIKREEETLEILSKLCRNLIYLRLPQGKWNTQKCFLTQDILADFIKRNPKLKIIDVSGFNIKSSLLINIFTSKYLKNLDFLKFCGECIDKKKPSLSAFMCTNYNWTFYQILSESCVPFLTANSLMRINPIKRLKTLPTVPTSLYCRTISNHRYCTKHCAIRFFQMAYKNKKFSFKLCHCIRSRLQEMESLYGRDIMSYCECTLTFLGWASKCKNFFSLDKFENFIVN